MEMRYRVIGLRLIWNANQTVTANTKAGDQFDSIEEAMSADTPFGNIGYQKIVLDFGDL